ncbi:hypothetical protein BGLA2_60096 [Burkholderia gladioli]|nr:hypothetical protein BGLA2_60096 [Burkholderia gladioli]
MIRFAARRTDAMPRARRRIEPALPRLPPERTDAGPHLATTVGFVHEPTSHVPQDRRRAAPGRHAARCELRIRANGRRGSPIAKLVRLIAAAVTPSASDARTKLPVSTIAASTPAPATPSSLTFCHHGDDARDLP